VDEGLRQEVRRLNGQIPFFPDVADVFRAFAFFDLPETRVVIMGQDCYPNPGEADGLCFSVSRSARCPPSLKNVFAELERTYGVRRTDADLSDWARQGVLLLNTALTVRMGRPGSHLPYWHAFVADVVREVCARTRAVVFLLWGSHAAEYEQCVYEHGQGRGHLVLKHSHPSPLARRPFVGCDHFRVANAFLQANAHKPAVRWV
jgi:uracil-DNA glycosylase